ncbi:conjugal transfer protein TrbH [Azospirillum thermophilum]|uniref:Conjugal transfer protein TrbH n=1 Tax=Azospirillum thermophilum TaxID=2202148 RepID=A0A2S2CVS4_9PROT|nr:conjugal transfer protein TrbH [Azospirillum thermophilum]AWK88612.1 conjugal transfer protein TrbH [Azospirillum thermophilum]
MRHPLHAAVVGVALLLGGCASFGPRSSYVEAVTPADAPLLAADIAGFVSDRLPAASTTVALDEPAGELASDSLTPVLRDELRRIGFGVAGADQKAPGAHALRYLVTPLNAGVLVRLQFDRTTASRLWLRNSAGTLQAGSPFTVREDAAE